MTQDTISQGTIDGYKSAFEHTENVQPRGLRASNTLTTLRPTEVVAVPEYPNPPTPESELDPPVEAESDAPVGAETDPPEEDRTWVLSLILDRLEELEDKFEALIARIEIHDIRASHRILRD